MQKTRSRLLSLILLLTLSACANSKSVEQTEEPSTVPTEQTAEPAFEPTAVLEDAAGWMPADTIGVAVVDGKYGYDLVERLMPESDDIESGEPGTLEALKTDLRKLNRERTGLDVEQVEAVAVGIGPSWQAVAAFGQFETTDKIKRVEVAGAEALRIPVDVSHELQRMLRGEVWALPVEQPRSGLIFFRTRDQLKKAVEARSAESLTLADGDVSAFSDQFGSIDADAAGLAVLLDRVPGLQAMGGRLPVPLPDRVGVGVGDSMGVTAEADQETLDAIEEFVAKYRSRVRKTLGEFSDDEELARESASTATLALTAYHFGTAYLNEMEPVERDGRLTYQVDVPGGPMGIAVAGVGTAIAIPAFVKYLKRSKASESSQIMKIMADGAKSYMESEQRSCKGMEECDQPWHTQLDAGMPKKFENKVFPGGTNVKLVSTTETPSNGEKYVPKPKLINGPDGVTAEDVMRKLNISFEDPLYFKYVYETGPKSGYDAEMTIKAIHDFDPAAPANHTVKQSVSVEQDQVVRVSPSIILNEFD